MTVEVSEELVIGVRWFQLRPDGILIGAAGAPWTDRYFEADCLRVSPGIFLAHGIVRNGGAAREHLMSAQCSCGVYIQDFEWAKRTGEAHAFPIKAVAVGWGACYLHSHGARVEKARLESLEINLNLSKRYMPSWEPREAAKLLEAHYEIPCTLGRW